MIRYENVITHLYEAFPDIRIEFEQRSKELYGDGLPHVVYGSVLVEYLNSLADRIDGQNHSTGHQRIKDILGFIEELSESGDWETRCLVQTGFIEGLLCEVNSLQRFEAQMGPETRKLASEYNK